MSPASAFPAERTPALPTGRALALYGLVIAVALLSLEGFWRSRGWRPSVADTPGLRAWHLDRAVHAGPDVVTLIGTSRMQLHFHPDTFAARFPGRPLANLSQAGREEATFVRHLNDRGFSGTALVGMQASHLVPDAVADSDAAWAELEAPQWHERLVAPGRAAVQFRAAVLQPDLGWRPALTALIETRACPPPSYNYVRPDRHRPADYQMLAERGELDRLRAVRVNHLTKGGYLPVEDAVWEAEARRLGEAVRGIRSRGGRVVLIRFPTTDGHWAVDEERFPKARYWDRLAELTGAETVHWRDVPALRGFDCPDTSHVDMRDTPAFTAALLDELRRRGAL